MTLLTSPTIALLTDFGTQDHYVGVMKGVMRRLCPAATFIDITHHIPPQNLRAAAFTLAAAVPYFPPQTVFLVVVDPGVGTSRRPIIVQTEHHTFIAPDNGVLSDALSSTPITTAASIDVNKLDKITGHTRSHTFHGRDVFAPAAALHAARKNVPIAAKIDLQELIQLPPPTLTITNHHIDGEVIYIDTFGNIITSIGPLHWMPDNTLQLHLTDQTTEISTTAQVTLAGQTLNHIHPTYGTVPHGNLLALIGSSGNLEIAVNTGDAASRLNIFPGDPIRLTIHPKRTS